MAFTYFFRDLQTLEMIRDYVVPLWRAKGRISIWDAGCAMGPEPYSLAIILNENMGNMLFRNVRIYGSDVDESGHFGDIIREGVYAEDQIKRIPKEILEQYFKPNGKPGRFILSEEIIKCVSFQWHDLLSLKPIREKLDLVVCKNVLLHFKKEERINVIRMFHDALGKGGFFVTEQTQKMPGQLTHLFEPVVSNAQLFQKRS